MFMFLLLFSFKVGESLDKTKNIGYLGGLSYSAFAIAFFTYYLFVILRDPIGFVAFKNLAFAFLFATASSVVISLSITSQKLSIKSIRILGLIALILLAVSLFFLFFERGVRYISVIQSLIETSGRTFRLERVRRIFIAMLIAYFSGVLAAYVWYVIHRKISNATGIKLFRAGGLLIFLGSILLIVGAGIILCEAGYMMCAIAFFRMSQFSQSTQHIPFQSR